MIRTRIKGPSDDRRATEALSGERDFVLAPGIYDLISALIADRLRFPELYATVASHLGLPDAGLASYSDMLARIATMVERTKTPVIVDADTGYGGLLNVRHPVQGYERADVSAVQIEDQQFPKKCGHTNNCRVVPMQEMIDKIMVAVETGRNLGKRFSSAYRGCSRLASRARRNLSEPQLYAMEPY